MKTTITNKLSTSVSANLALILLCVMSLQAGPGDLDPTFGNGGKVTTAIGIASRGSGVAIQSDGKIIAVGPSYTSSTSNDFTLVRYNPDGTLDATFGTGGMVITPGGTQFSYDEATDVALQPDGKIVVTGWSDAGGTYDFVVIRYHPDGSLDTSFDGDGKVITPIGTSTQDEAAFVAIQPDGKILVAGSSESQHYDFAIVRYNPNGSLDTSFGSGGKVVTPIGQENDFASSLAIQSDGKIVAAGRIGSVSSGHFDLALVRYNANGSLDTTFASGGRLVTPIGTGSSGAASVVIQSDGKIVAAGGVAFATSDFLLIRYNPNGSLDASFDGDGIVRTPGGGAGSIVIQSDGKIVVAGSSDNGSNYDFALLRYNTNGSLDTTFGGGDGITRVDFNNSADYGGQTALDGQGRAVVVGSSYNNSTNDIALARLLLEPSRAPFDYDGDGKTDVSVFRPSTNEWHIMQSSGGIRVQGWGLAGDKMAPADFDGDGKTDLAVFRPGEGNWYILNSSNNTVTVAGWGLLNDLPVPADYNGDGKADLVVYRPSNRNWYRRDSDGLIHVFEWGLADDRPAPADFTGDGRTDMAVFRSGSGTWYVLSSSDFSVTTTNWGVTGDVPVPADYSGDGKADFVVFRPSDLTWYRRNSDDGSLHFITWGLAGDIPVPGDYDGDGKTDLAVYRPSDDTWYIFGSQAGINSQPFGLAADLPTPSAFVY